MFGKLTTWRSSVVLSGVKGPTLLEDQYGVYEYATIRAYGDTTHTFVNRDRYQGAFAPGSIRSIRLDTIRRPITLRFAGHRPHRRQLSS